MEICTKRICNILRVEVEVSYTVYRQKPQFHLSSDPSKFFENAKQCIHDQLLATPSHCLYNTMCTDLACVKTE